jgi:hypothetical protein
MRLRNDRNAVSITTALVAFLLVGCMIAAYALWAGCEAVEVKGGLIVYACIAGPLFLAAAHSTFGPSAKHRSFRTTPPAYMEGRRVKRRLGVIYWASIILALGAGSLAAVSVFLLLQGMGGGGPFGLLAEALILLGFVTAVYLVLFFSKALFVRLDWMTPEEAKSFPLRKGEWWPESWLEPVDEGEATAARGTAENVVSGHGCQFPPEKERRN